MRSAKHIFPCSVDGCTNPGYVHAMCKTHYDRLWRNGDLIVRHVGRYPPGSTCSVDGCNKPIKCKDLCGAHYARQRAHDLRETPITPMRGTPPLTDLPPEHTREQWLIWAAGFFDGEGCIGIYKNSSSHDRHTLEIATAQVDTRPLYIMQALFGGRLTTHGQQTKRPVFYWKASSAQAAKAVSEMQPYLVVKREQAECAIRFAATMTTNHIITPAIAEEREAMRERVGTLKRLSYSLDGDAL